MHYDARWHGYKVIGTGINYFIKIYKDMRYRRNFSINSCN